MRNVRNCEEHEELRSEQPQATPNCTTITIVNTTNKIYKNTKDYSSWLLHSGTQVPIDLFCSQIVRFRTMEYIRSI